jgi:hypothetical protein
LHLSVKDKSIVLYIEAGGGRGRTCAYKKSRGLKGVGGDKGILMERQREVIKLIVNHYYSQEW